MGIKRRRKSENFRVLMEDFISSTQVDDPAEATRQTEVIRNVSVEKKESARKHEISSSPKVHHEISLNFNI